MGPEENIRMTGRDLPDFARRFSDQLSTKHNEQLYLLSLCLIIIWLNSLSLTPVLYDFVVCADPCVGWFLCFVLVLFC